MDRHAKKLEKKRKSRDQAKKKASTLAAKRPSSLELLARSAAREPFGPCFVSAGWDDLDRPEIVSLLITRALPSGHFMVGTALIDRTCLGIKNGFASEPMLARDLEQLVERIGTPHGGMVPCEPLVAQSIVFHAIDYAHALGFAPHRDFPATLLGARPAELLDTPWSKPERPIFVSGPHDDERAIERQLAKVVGPDGFDLILPFDLTDEDDDEDDEEERDQPQLAQPYS